MAMYEAASKKTIYLLIFPKIQLQPKRPNPLLHRDTLRQTWGNRLDKFPAAVIAALVKSTVKLKVG